MTLKESIYATLVYFDLFDYPLSIQEIGKFLLWNNASRDDLWALLNNDPGIQRHGNFYFLKGRREIVDLRRDREVVAAKYWVKVRKFLPVIQTVPFIKMVAVCNTLAFNNPTAESDIDLFIVVQKGRLFLARMFATVLFALMGVRRSGKKVAGRFCLSFYVTDDALNLEGIRQGQDDIYLPFWLLTLKPIYGHAVFDDLIRQNQWVQKYFPRIPETESTWKGSRLLRGIGRIQEKIYSRKLGDRLEEMISKWQTKRYQRKLADLGPNSSVVVSDKMLKFHNIDRRQEFASRFQKRYEEVGSQVF